MTQRLYYDDSYTTEFTARVIERTIHNERPAIVLDRTYFYPTGGGQPHDRGLIGGVEVLDVFARDEDHAVVHVTTEQAIGEIITCNVDWQRRFDHMQQHTGQHLLTQCFVENAGTKTIGFHLSPNRITIDLDKAGLTVQTVDSIEELANRIVQENRAVTARVVEPEEAESLGARIRRIPGHLATGGLRVVEIAEFDLTACGGTHVARTGEIGVIKILKVENYKGGSRVEFACGGRALADYRAKHNAVLEIAAGFSVGSDEIAGAVSRMKDDLKATQTNLKRAYASLVELEVPALLASASEQAGLRIICRAYEDRDAGDVRALASKLVQQPGVIALLGAAGDKAQLFAARSSDLPYDMNSVLQSGLAVLGARGGGRPDFAQGGGMAATVDHINAALAASAETLIRQTAQAG
jgi:alanyl-tRNA synthetase